MIDHLTLSQIAELVGEPRHIVNFAIARFGPAPSGRLGTTRFWSKDQLPAVRLSLSRTARRSHLSRRQKRLRGGRRAEGGCR